MPLRLRHGYAAGIHRGLPIGDINRPRSSPHFVRVRTATQPISVRFGAGGSLLRGVQTLIHSRYTFPSRSPDARSSDSADPPRLCQGCLPPSPVSPGSGCPQLLLARCDEPTAVSFHHGTVQGASWRSRSPSQCPGTARSSTSAGRSEIMTMSMIPLPLGSRAPFGQRRARP